MNSHCKVPSLVLTAVSILYLTSGYCECAHAQQVAQQNGWSQFLGDDGTGESRQLSPPVSWDANQYRWRVDLPGIGWSSPVYSDGRIWVTAADVKPASDDYLKKKRQGVQFADIKTAAGSLVLRALCVDLESGKLLHNIQLATIENPELINPLNSYASPTPAIANGKVVCHFGTYGTWCLDSSDGRELWKTQYVIDHSVGPGSSPIVFQEKVILVCDGIDKQFVAAVSLSNGQEIWKTSRPPMRNQNGEYQKAYSTPLVVDVKGEKQLVIPGAQWIVAYHPGSGKEIWRVDHGAGFSVTPMANVESGLVIFSTGFMRPEVVAIDPNGTGDVTATNVKWRVKNGPTMPSMVSADGKVYFISDKGILYCADAMTGKVLNRKRLGGNFSASPLLIGKHLYVSSREGKVFVIKADQSLEEVGANRFDGKIMATPAPYQDDLIFRVDNRLYRVGKSAG